VPVLEDSADVLIALTHIGSEMDVRLADTLDDIDVVVGGHDQVLIPRPLEEDDVLIAQAQEHGLYLGRLDLRVEGDEVELVADTVYPITGEVPDDPEVARMVASYTRRLDRELRKTVGQLATPLNAERDEIRRSQTNFGILLATLMREATGAEIGVMNAGGIRSSIDAGPVTLGEIVQALPFANRVTTVELPGSAVERMHDRSASLGRRGDSGGYLQLSGVHAPAGAEEGDGGLVEVGGRPLEPNALFTVALPDFLYNGGDGYELFRREGRNPRDTGKLLSQLLADHIRTNSPLAVPDPG
jgi:5'-nucleotidase/UDP-sugar diphosphatase